MKKIISLLMLSLIFISITEVSAQDRDFRHYLQQMKSPTTNTKPDTLKATSGEVNLSGIEKRKGQVAIQYHIQRVSGTITGKAEVLGCIIPGSNIYVRIPGTDTISYSDTNSVSGMFLVEGAYWNYRVKLTNTGNGVGIVTGYMLWKDIYPMAPR